jgi:hypothetical protein
LFGGQGMLDVIKKVNPRYLSAQLLATSVDETNKKGMTLFPEDHAFSNEH